MQPAIVITGTEYPKIPKLKLQFTWIRPLTAHERDCCVHTVEEEKLIPANAKGILGFHLHGTDFDKVKITVDK